jgi:hypothetical protein
VPISNAEDSKLAQMRRFRSIRLRFVMRIFGLADVRRTRNVTISASLTANNFANKLHGTEENGAALNATAHLDAPNVLGLFGLARYTPMRSLSAQTGRTQCERGPQVGPKTHSRPQEPGG